MQRSHDEEIRSEALQKSLFHANRNEPTQDIITRAISFEQYLNDPKVANINTTSATGGTYEPSSTVVLDAAQMADSVREMAIAEGFMPPDNPNVAPDPEEDYWYEETVNGAWVWMSNEELDAYIPEDGDEMSVIGEDVFKSYRPAEASNVSIFVYGEFDPEAIADVINRISNGDSQ